jgi:N-acetylmuramoyl-L-alanine amidase
MKPRWAWAAFTAVVMAAAVAAQAHAATVASVAQSVHGNMVELRFQVRGQGLDWSRLEQHQQLIIELANVRMKLPARPLAGQTIAPITSITAYATGPRDGRVVIDVKGKVDYAITFAMSQLIVRFARAGSAPEIAAPIVMRRRIAPVERRDTPARREEAASGGQVMSQVEPEKTRARVEPAAVFPPQPLSPAPLVVIDPGHGGRDPGTRAANGIAEKDLALQIALRLGRELKAAGVRAELTRTDDRFLSLAERTAIANRAHADLFISIHLNSSPDTDTTGIETYYLNNTTDRATIRLARMENSGEAGAAISRQPDLHYILTDLRQGDKANEAESLSQMIEVEAAAAMAAASGARVNDLGARRGPFYVLVGAEMPSVLVECGFLSNPGEAQRLTSAGYQAGLAKGIARAVANYFNGELAVGNL